MNKIPTALIRDPNNRAKVLPEITPGCEWVFTGEGVPTRKYDGTCTMLDENEKWWARREVKPGREFPPNFVLVHFDVVTQKNQGWEPIEQSPFYKFFLEALEYEEPAEYGTYELVGPKINNNEINWAGVKFEKHYLFEHATAQTLKHLDFAFPPATVMMVLDRLCKTEGIEGVVWHHPDGRMAKLKGRDL